MIKQKEEIENKVAERKKDSATKMAKDEANTKEYIADLEKKKQEQMKMIEEIAKQYA